MGGAGEQKTREWRKEQAGLSIYFSESKELKGEREYILLTNKRL